MRRRSGIASGSWRGRSGVRGSPLGRRPSARKGLPPAPASASSRCARAVRRRPQRCRRDRAAGRRRHSGRDAGPQDHPPAGQGDPRPGGHRPHARPGREPGRGLQRGPRGPGPDPRRADQDPPAGGGGPPPAARRAEAARPAALDDLHRRGALDPRPAARRRQRPRRPGHHQVPGAGRGGRPGRPRPGRAAAPGGRGPGGQAGRPGRAPGAAPGPPGRQAPPDRVPAGRPAPLPQAPGPPAPASRGRRTPTPGAAAAPGAAAPAGRRAGGPGAGRRPQQHVVGLIGRGRRPLRGRRPGGRVRQGPAGQAVPVGGVRAELVRLLGPDHGRLPQRRGVAAPGQPGPVGRRPPRRPRRPRPGGPRVLRPQPRQPEHHPPRRHVHRRRRHDRGPYSGASVRVASIGRRDYIGAVRPTG